MKAELKAKLIAALRSGRYTQARHRMYDAKTGGYCCMGVACVELLGAKPDESGAILGQEFTIGWRADTGFGIDDETRARLERMNDSGSTFAEIADWIEANVPVDA
jgi:hypothetical protein